MKIDRPLRAGRWGWALALLAGLSACDDGPGSAPAGAQGVDAGLDAGIVAGPSELIVDVDPSASRPTGPLLLLAEHVETADRIVRHLAGVTDRWPARFDLDDLAPGRYRLTIFQDRDGDDVFDGCPFPAMPADTERADTLDNVYGTVDADLTQGGTIEVTLARHVCGPGDALTGMRGVLAPPEDADLAGMPVFLLLEPLDTFRPTEFTADAGPAEGPAAVALRLPLFPDGLDGPTAFDVGELVPGVYRLTFFADADGDHSPSLCQAQGLGGGDRFAQTVDRFQVVAGRHTDLGEPLALVAAPCPAALTGLTGTLELTDELQQVLGGDGDALRAQGLLAGPVRLALVPQTGGEPVEAMPLLASADARPLPHRFTVTGLPPGTWRIVVWIDRDRDGLFAPCNGLPAGLDAVYHVREDVYVREGQLLELGSVLLDQGECQSEAPTGVLGRLAVELESGSVGSGRPVRLELLPVDAVGERRSILLFENHRQLPVDPDATEDDDGYARFVVNGGVMPGRYRAVAYVDYDRDGAFVPCLDAPFADRAASGLLDRCDDDECPTIEVVPGTLADLGELEVRTLGCEVPSAQVEPVLRVAARAPMELIEAGPVRLRLEEAGGWHDDRLLRMRVGLPGEELLGPPVPLAPGRYRVTAYVDADGDGAYGDCGSEALDPIWGRAEVALDEANPQASVDLVLDRRCPR